VEKLAGFCDDFMAKVEVLFFSGSHMPAHLQTILQKNGLKNIANRKQS